MASKIIGCGGYLPTKVLTNDDLAQFVDTNDEWIKSRTGIDQRHIAANGEFTSHMAHKAALDAIADADININEIELIIVCSTTPDNSFPGVANKLQGYLNLKNIPSFDLQAVCSGFIYGLHVADNMIKSGAYKTILLVCAEKMSSLLNWQDRTTSVLFGDGAGAIILKHEDSDAGVIDSHIHSDGSMYDILYTNGGISSTQTTGTIQMNGREVFKNAIEKMTTSINNILEKNNFILSDINYVIPHQANIRIINNIALRLGIDSNKVITTVAKHANCSAASIPLALNEFKKTQKIKKGDLLVFTAFGAGTTWGSAIIRW